MGRAVTLVLDSMINLEQLDALQTLERTRRLSILTALDLTDASGLDNLRGELYELELRRIPLLDGIEFLSGATITDRLQIESLGSLTSLGGPTFAAEFGQVELRNNPLLTDLSALATIGELRQLNLSSNAAVVSFESAFSSLRVLGELELEAMAGLTSLDGLGGLERIGSPTNRSRIYLAHNPALTSIAALDSVPKHVDWLNIYDNSVLASLEGLSGLDHCEGIRISSNPALASLSGLSELAAISSRFSVDYNHGLESLDGLPALRLIGDDLLIDMNQRLSDVEELHDVTITGSHASVSNNPCLTQSAVDALEAALIALRFGGQFEAYYNDEPDNCSLTP